MNIEQLEQTMRGLNQIQSDIDTLSFAIGDSPRQYTTDELLNMLFGMSQMHQVRYDKLQTEYTQFKKFNTPVDQDDMFVNTDC